MEYSSHQGYLSPHFDLADENRTTPPPPLPEIPPTMQTWPSDTEGEPYPESSSDEARKVLYRRYKEKIALREEARKRRLEEAQPAKVNDADYGSMKMGEEESGASKGDVAGQSSSEVMSGNGKEDLDLVHDDDDDDNGDESDGDGYEVEEILASEWLDVDGGYRYHVKWNGGEKTWEPEENLDGCAELLSEFWSKKRKKATKKQVQPRKRAKSTR